MHIRPGLVLAISELLFLSRTVTQIFQKLNLNNLELFRIGNYNAKAIVPFCLINFNFLIKLCWHACSKTNRLFLLSLSL